MTYARAEEDVMAHFKQYVPKTILTIKYEDLLVQPKKTITRVLNFIGQRFEPECLEFYNDHRPVTTLSKAQVRKPISKAPLSSWRHYEAQINDALNNGNDAQTNQVNL
jgi:hypothetical protein